MKKKRTRKPTSLTDRLLILTGRWIAENGGSAVVAGPIGIMVTGKHEFSLCIGILGRPPVKKEKP